MSDISEHNLEPFAELEKALEKQGYGTVSVSFQVHQGHIVGIQGNQFREVRFKEGQNTEAMALVLAEVKDLHTQKRSGNFTFTVKLDKGEIKTVWLQRNLNKRYLLTNQDPEC
jgi:hypothetical protein